MAYNHQQLFARLDSQLSVDLAVRLARFAQDIGVSKNTVGKAVRQITGLSFSQYRQAKRLERAIQLLRAEPATSIKSIAIGLGYEYPGALTRFIKTKTGCTASQVRQGAFPPS